MKTTVVNGIPYAMNTKQELYVYGTLLLVGTLSEDKQSVIFSDSWVKNSEAHKLEYRTMLKEKTIMSMDRAKNQFEGKE